MFETAIIVDAFKLFKFDSLDFTSFRYDNF